MQIYVEDETEFDWWQNGTVSDFEVVFDGPYKLDASDNHKLTLELTETYIEDVDVGSEGEALSATLSFYTKAHTSDNALKATVQNSVYSY